MNNRRPPVWRHDRRREIPAAGHPLSLQGDDAFRNRRRHPHRFALTVVFSLIVFFILVITMLIVGVVIYLLVQAGVITMLGEHLPGIVLPIAMFGLTSIVVGTFVSLVLSGLPLRPVSALIAGLNKLAGGDFNARLELRGPPIAQDISKSFNTLADELENTEMLRSDFINNFSHEFKTPIVSIRGFAKLLQKGGVTAEQQQEYLDIIAEEAGRLSAMATNVLQLTKVENQNILTDVTAVQLSEQLRDCLLLLENRWSSKELDVVAEFEEYTISASEELLKQVWINLLDNAIKFSPVGGTLTVTISQESKQTAVSIENTGSELTEQDKRRMFDKFWQGDASHASEGTGIGLSIARRIVQLHSGSITATSADGHTIFTVTLPQE